MKLDLGALDSQAGATGEPLDIACSLIDPDPTQPRRTFDTKALEELADSIRARAARNQRGVISPISVRPHPDSPGRWLLNHGERRLRASILAEQPTVPAFVDAAHDDDDQVLENLQREDLEPMELAEYVAEQLGKGRKAADIARRLGKPKATITLYRTLADLPPALQQLYDRELCRSPRMLYDLERLQCKHPDAVERWAADRTDAVTTRDVEALRARLAPPKVSPARSAPAPSSAPENAVETPVPPAAPATRSKPARDAGSTAQPIVRRLVVRHGDREAVAVLAGPLVLQFEDGTEAEADAADVVLERVEER